MAKRKNPPPANTPDTQPGAAVTAASADNDKARKQAILDYVSQAGEPVSVNQVTDAITKSGITSPLIGRGLTGQTSRALKALIEEGLIDKRGKARGMRYFVRGAGQPVTDEE